MRGNTSNNKASSRVIESNLPVKLANRDNALSGLDSHTKNPLRDLIA